MRTRRTALAFFAPLALALAAACAGEAGPSPRERLSSAAGATMEVGTTAFSMDVRIRTGADTAAGTTMTMSGRGAADLDTGASRMEMELGGLGIPITMLYDGDTVFVRMPGMMTGGEARWIRRPAPRAGGMGTGAAGFAGDPSPFLAALDGIDADIERLGADTVRGTGVQGFRLTVPGARFWRGPGEAPAALAGMEVPTEVWLDDRDRVRRMSVEMDLAAAMGAAREAAGDSLSEENLRMLEAMGRDMAGDMTLTMELFDFGTEVVTRPPDSVEVIDADSLGRGMMMQGPGAAGGEEGSGG